MLILGSNFLNTQSPPLVDTLPLQAKLLTPSGELLCSLCNYSSMQSRYEQFGQLNTEQIIDHLGRQTTAITESADTRAFLQNLLSARIADSLVRALAGSAEATGKSANALRDAL